MYDRVKKVERYVLVSYAPNKLSVYFPNSVRERKLKKKSLVQLLDLDEDHSADLPSSGTPRLRTARPGTRPGARPGAGPELSPSHRLESESEPGAESESKQEVPRGHERAHGRGQRRSS